MPTTNLQWAQLAVDHVATFSMRSSNRPVDKPDQALDDRILAQDLAYLNTEQVLDTVYKEIKRKAKLAVEHGVGNCEMKASLAFDYLARQPGHPRLELMALNANVEVPEEVTTTGTGKKFAIAEPDHVFVLLGRTGGAIVDHTTWNFDAVICDPWAKRCYRACYFADEMGFINRVSGGATKTVQKADFAANANW